jgi:hypothetical protein
MSGEAAISEAMVIDWVELRCGGCTAVGGEVESRCDRLTRGYLALRRVGEVKAEVKVVVPCRSCCLCREESERGARCVCLKKSILM